jgi:hypothetical protein
MARSILASAFTQTITANSFVGFGGPSYAEATESLTNLYIYNKAKLYGFYINPSSTADGRYYTIRKNGADSTLKIGPWNTVNGTNSVSNGISITINSGDYINMSYNAAANSAFSSRVILKPYGRHFFILSSTPQSAPSSFGVGTRYTQLGGSMIVTTAEDRTHFKVKVPGTLTNMQLKVTTNTTGTANVFTRISNTLGNLNIFVGAGQTGHFSDISRSDAVSANSTINVRAVIATAAITFSQFSAHFEPTNVGSKKQELCVGAGATITPSLTPSYTPIVGGISASSSESSRSLTFGYPVKLNNLRIYSHTNSCNTTFRVTTRVNSTNTTLYTDIAAGSTGWFENNVDGIVVNPNDTVSFRLEALSAPTGTLIVSSIGLTAEDLSPPDYPKISMQ